MRSAIADQLLNALQCDGKFLRHGKDGGEPDVIYSVNWRTVGIEVYTAYLGEGAARVDWDLADARVRYLRSAAVPGATGKMSGELLRRPVRPLQILGNRNKLENS